MNIINTMAESVWHRNGYSYTLLQLVIFFIGKIPVLTYENNLTSYYLSLETFVQPAFQHISPMRVKGWLMTLQSRRIPVKLLFPYENSRLSLLIICLFIGEPVLFMNISPMKMSCCIEEI